MTGDGKRKLTLSSLAPRGRKKGKMRREHPLAGGKR